MPLTYTEKFVEQAKESVDDSKVYAKSDREFSEKEKAEVVRKNKLYKGDYRGVAAGPNGVYPGIDF